MKSTRRDGVSKITPWHLAVIAVCALASLATSHRVEAAYREDCILKYVSTGKKYSVECTYIVGSELNERTNSFSYQGSALYVVVFWNNDEATVIRTRNMFLCGFEATNDCANSFTPIAGTDQEDREWKICQPHHFSC